MTKPKDHVQFGLDPGFRIENYQVVRRLGSGLTAEAYLAVEVMTGAQRVVKVFANKDSRDPIKRQRDFAHYAWVLETISKAGTRILPSYHHMGHVFLPSSGPEGTDDNSSVIGNYFIVQELIDGAKVSAKTLRALHHRHVAGFVAKILDTHAKAGLALGDIDPKNLLLCPGSKEIRMVDCDYGFDNEPNEDFQGDLAELLQLFGPRIKAMIARRRKAKPKRPKRPKKPLLRLSYTPSKPPFE